jgi:hypothetical protein
LLTAVYAHGARPTSSLPWVSSLSMAKPLPS